MLQLPILILLDTLTATAPFDLDFASPNLTCCNGGRPYVEAKGWPSDWNSFKELPATDGSSPKCRAYLLHLPEWLTRKLAERRGVLRCKCTRDHYGSSCEVTRQAQDASGEGQSFKMFLLLAVIPLTFALLAAVGGFLCRMCCCHIIGFECFNLSWYLGGAKESETADEAFEPTASAHDIRAPSPPPPPAADTEMYPGSAQTRWSLTRSTARSPASREYEPNPVYCGPPPSYEAAVRQCRPADIER
uniref:EGF-like domain-containing protein n=1 Tax=Trichuris muris TaxID=70415 RepID=A0A5S6QC13_TRIMR